MRTGLLTNLNVHIVECRFTEITMNPTWPEMTGGEMTRGKMTGLRSSRYVMKSLYYNHKLKLLNIFTKRFLEIITQRTNTRVR